MVIAKKRKLKLSEMEAIAKEATRAALIGYVPPTVEEEKNLTLASGITDTEGVFGAVYCDGYTREREGN